MAGPDAAGELFFVAMFWAPRAVGDEENRGEDADRQRGHLVVAHLDGGGGCDTADLVHAISDDGLSSVIPMAVLSGGGVLPTSAH